MGQTRLSCNVMSVRRAKPSVTGDKGEEGGRRAGRKNALQVRNDMVAVRVEKDNCSKACWEWRDGIFTPLDGLQWRTA